jgi:DNA-binding response OmpR family regulator
MEHKTILMIEDDKSLITLNGKMLAALSGGGFSTLTAVTLAEAREKLTGGIDLILLDVMLPDGNGLDFVREIRAVTGAPIIILNARREPEQITEGLLAGGVDYITKPYRMEELYARVSAKSNRRSCGKSHPSGSRAGR